MKDRSSIARQALGIFCAALVLQFSAGAPLVAQQEPPLQQLSADQLDNLVAPIALYPDALLSQVLVAATYPLELAEAGQWLQQNRNLQGSQLVDTARQQNWDASIQALVVFPDVIERLNSNIRWTTDLGNAFLSQQADVMNAVQQLRAEARAAGKLNSDTEETIATDTQGGQTAIEIQPANPEVVYVPSYNPEAIWGPPAYGYYPPLYYPAGFGFGFGPGIYIGGFFGGLGWGGWGWGPNWFGGSIFVNGSFFNHYGFRSFGGRGFVGRGTWAHNPEHRLGVSYPNQRVANRFGGTFGARASFAGARSAPAMSHSNGTSHVNGGGNGNLSNRGNLGPSAGYRSSQSFNGGNGAVRSAPAYRPSQSFNGGNGAVRSTPAYRPSQTFNGGGVRSVAPASRPSPTFNGGGGTVRSAPSSGGGRGGSSGGSSFHSSGGGGGGAHASGGGSHGGGRR